MYIEIFLFMSSIYYLPLLVARLAGRVVRRDLQMRQVVGQGK